MTKLTYEDLRASVRDIDDHTAIEILDSGCSLEDLIEAKTWVASDENFFDSTQLGVNQHVATVVRILEQARPPQSDDSFLLDDE